MEELLHGCFGSDVSFLVRPIFWFFMTSFQVTLSHCSIGLVPWFQDYRCSIGFGLVRRCKVPNSLIGALKSFPPGSPELWPNAQGFDFSAAL